MTWIIPWNGVDYDVDPTEFTGGELKQVKLMTGFSFRKLTEALLDFDGDAINVIFWIAARRTNPALKYSDFDGPPLKLVMANLDGLNDAMGELGKAMGMPETPEMSGSESSPSTPAGTETPTTD